MLHGDDAPERRRQAGVGLSRASTRRFLRDTGAILLYGIPHVVVGENRTFMGEEDLLRARGVHVDVVQDESCIRMMQDFIAKQPTLWNEDIGE